MDANFVLRISILLILMVFFGIFVYKSYSHNAFSKNGKGGNRLGKAMVNMERACTFDDPINFYEFAKYAIREAMCLPQG
ncbi:MAG: hypothetical protein LBS87_01550, partial [Puniceicoccales bacterium]|nr:hypothetical protein [Puniceicoccales bacterium]